MLHQLELTGFILHFPLTKPFNSPKLQNSSHNLLLLPTAAGKFLLPPSLRGMWLDTAILVSSLIKTYHQKEQILCLTQHSL